MEYFSRLKQFKLTKDHGGTENTEKQTIQSFQI